MNKLKLESLLKLQYIKDKIDFYNENNIVYKIY